MVFRTLFFMPVLVLSYFALLLIFSLGAEQMSAANWLLEINDATEGAKDAPGFSHSLLRLREVETAQAVDILFLGSSHAYRSFDTRIFQKAGFSSFNLGSTAQTSLNSYYLLRRYFDRFQPKLIIFETYYKVFESEDGLESFYDLARNAPLTGDLLAMAFATRSPQAVHFFFSEYFKRIKSGLNLRPPARFPGETYIPGGYVETAGVLREQTERLRHEVALLSGRQWSYLSRIIAFAKNHGVRIVLVVQPLPREYLDAILNYKSISARFNEFAKKNNVAYYDFNERMTLDSSKDFMSGSHLNSSGVEKFNNRLIQDLKKELDEIRSDTRP